MMLARREDLVTVREAAQQCSRTSETVRRWIWEGKLPAQKLGNQLFIRKADLARLTARGGAGGKMLRLAAFERAKLVREQIRERIGGRLDVLDMLDRSREAHP